MKNSIYEKYKIYLDDYTEIDEDDILMELTQQAKESLTLIVVPDGIDWNSDAKSNSSSKPENAHAQPCSSAQNQSCVLTQNEPEKIQINHVSRIFPKLGSQSQEYLRNKKLIDKKNRKSMISVVVDYMVADLKDFRRGTAQLRQQIYDALNYRKSAYKNASLSIGGIECTAIAKQSKQDEYGCVAYLPNLPPSETPETQLEKRLSLLEMFNSSTHVDAEVIKLMNETYYLQRQEITKEKDLSKILNDWPFLSSNTIFLNHADRLLDKSSSMIWSECLETLAKPINKYFKNSEIASEYSCRHKKLTEKLKNDVSEKNHYIRSAITNAKDYSLILNNDSPFSDIIFKFIARFMKEDIDFLYCFQNEELEDTDLLYHTPVVTPILMIRDYS